MTRKLMLWLTGATILFWIAAAGVGASVMREEFDEVFDSSLQETAQRLMPLVVNGLFQHENSADPLRMDSGSAEGEEYLTYQLRDKEGRVLLHSHDAQREPFDAPLKRGFSDTPTHRFYTQEAVSGTLFLQVADLLEHRNEAVREGALSLLLPLIFLVPLSMIIIWVLVRRSLAPLETLRGEIGARDGGNLTPMAVGNFPVELATIGVSVNRLFDRLRRALDAEKAFASNSAHELRTPIAGALAQTQRLIAELPDGLLKRRARGIEASLSALSRLAEKLLQLARAESGIGAAPEPVDIVPIVRLVVQDFAQKPETAGRLQLDLGEIGDGSTMMLPMDVDALGIILRNLIENALLHGAQNSPVHVVVRKDDTIRVWNAGPLVPPAELQELTKRFKRGTSAAAGSGLGLAIADMLVRQMGGTLELGSPASGKQDGFEAILRLSSQ